MGFLRVALPEEAWVPGEHAVSHTSPQTCAERGVTRLELSPGFADANACKRGHIFHVLSGTLELTLCGATERLQAGEVCFIDEGTPHVAKNPGSEPVRFLVFPRGPASERVTDGEALETLRAREALMAEAEGITRVGSYLWKPGSPPMWSDEFFRILGYTPGTLRPSAEAFHACVHPEDRERVLKAQIAAADGTLPDIEYRILRADTGELRFLRGIGRVYRDEALGLTRRMVGAIMDVTDAKLRALRDEQALVTMRAAERLGKVGSFVVRPLPLELEWSKGLCEITGLHDPHASGEQRLALVHPDDRDKQMAWWISLLAREAMEPLLLRFVRMDGEVRHAQVHAALLRFESDGVERVAGTVVDVTERVVLEEQLRHAAKMEAVGTLAAGVAHDFNNYLTVMSGSLDLIANPLCDASTQGELLENAQHALTRCMGLTQQLLAFARRQPARSEAVDLGRAVTRFGPLLQPTLGRVIRLTLQLPEAPVFGQIDPGQLEQVLANLGLNSRDAIAARSGAEGQVTIAVDTVTLDTPCRLFPGEVDAGHWARIRVTDDGCGIAEEHVSRIFDPYFTTKDLGRGTGLGLASVYGTVSQHGGHVTVDSQINRGTTFSIWLRAVDAPAASEKPAQERRSSQPRVPRILVVDDMAEVRCVAALSLRSAGFEVIEAADGLEALACVASQEPDLVVTDIRMPRMDGLTLAAELRRRFPTLQVVLMTGYSETPITDTSLPVLNKPFSPEQLVNECRRWL